MYSPSEKMIFLIKIIREDLSTLLFGIDLQFNGNSEMKQ